MSRKLIVGADVAVTGATALEVYKKDVNGEPVFLTAGDTLLTAPEIQFCRSGSGEFSPWIQGEDLIRWSGESGVAQTAQSLAITSLAPTTAGTMLTLTLVDKSNGYEPFARESIEFAAGATANLTATSMNTAIAAHIAVPGYAGMIASTAVVAPVVTITGHTYAGPTAAGYNRQTNIETAFDANGDATAGINVVDTQATSTMGDPYILADFEVDLVGQRSGDYYRIQQPQSNTYYVPNPSLNFAHDVYCLQWRSRYENGQINKVDNTHELYLAVAHAAAGGGSAPGTWVQSGGGSFETIMNGYLASTPASIQIGGVAL